MKKRIIYGIGTTASSTLAKFKELSEEEFIDESIFCIWDLDAATDNLSAFDEHEKRIYTEEEDIQKRIRDIKADQHNYPEKYKEIARFFPIENQRIIDSLPVTHGLGAARNPIVSRLISQLHQNEINKTIDQHCIDLKRSKGNAEAFVLMSSCGGTSTGLNIEILSQLLRNDISVYLFFLCPTYFFNVVDSDNEPYITNNIATLLRTFYDLEKKGIAYVNPPICSSGGAVFPFIIESELKEDYHAEYRDSSNQFDRQLFLEYNAKVLKAFFTQQADTQNFTSTVINELQRYQTLKKFMNVVLLYPNSGTRSKAMEVLSKKMNAKSRRSGEAILLDILKKQESSITLEGVINKMLINPAAIQERISGAINVDIPLGDILEALQYIKLKLTDNKNLWVTIPPSSRSQEKQDKNIVPDTIGSQRENQSFITRLFTRIISLFQLSKNENSTSPSSPSSPVLFNKEEVKKFYEWCLAAIENFEANRDFVSSHSNVEQKTDSTEESIQFPIDQKILEQRTYLQDLIEAHVALHKTSASDFWGAPPCLKRASAVDLLLDKPIGIENQDYQLRIYSGIADHDVMYLRNNDKRGEDYLNIYLKRFRNKTDWCYPDQRLQGFTPLDPLAQDFRIWHNKIVSSLGNAQSKEILETADDQQAKLYALASISDLINQKNAYFDPIIDFKKSTEKGSYFYLEYNGNGDAQKVVRSEEGLSITTVFNSFFSKVKSSDPLIYGISLPAEKYNKILIQRMIEESTKQILEYQPGSSMESLVQEVLQKINNTKDSLRTGNASKSDMQDDHNEEKLKIAIILDLAKSHLLDLLSSRRDSQDVIIVPDGIQ